MIFTYKGGDFIRRDWSVHEKAIMRKYGLIPQPASGAGELFKEDGRSERLLAQLKSTEGKSISFKKRDALDLVKNAGIAHKIPIFMFDFVDGTSDFVWIAARAYDLEEVVKEFRLLKVSKEGKP